MIERVGSQASERRTERSDGLNLLGLRSGRPRKSRSLRRAGRVIPPNPTRPARSHYWSDLSHFQRNSTGPVSPSEQPDRPGFRANFSRWGLGGLDLKPHPIRAVVKLPKTHPIRVSSGFDYLRTDQMFGPMPLLIPSSHFTSKATGTLYPSPPARSN